MNMPAGVQIAVIAGIVIIILACIFRDRVDEIVFGPAKMRLFKPEEIQATTDIAKEIAHNQVPQIQQGFSPH